MPSYNALEGIMMSHGCHELQYDCSPKHTDQLSEWFHEPYYNNVVHMYSIDSTEDIQSCCTQVQYFRNPVTKELKSGSGILRVATYCCPHITLLTYSSSVFLLLNPIPQLSFLAKLSLHAYTDLNEVIYLNVFIVDPMTS